MIRSIRAFLLFNLLLSVTLIISLATFGYLYIERKELQSDFDAQLALTGHTVDAFLNGSSSSTKQAAQKIEKKLLALSNAGLYTSPHKNPTKDQLDLFMHSTRFQIWDQANTPLLGKEGLPKNLQCQSSGFKKLTDDGENWHSFTLKNPERGVCVAVLQKEVLRHALEREIIKDTLLIMLLTYVVLGLLIWGIIGKGFQSLSRIITAIKKRKSTHLAPVNIEGCPTEIQPLVDELNELFERMHETFTREKQFAADAAHELRTPLAALSTQAQVALHATDEAEREAALKKVLTGVERSTHIVHQLLALSRMMPDITIPNKTNVDIKKLAIEIIALLDTQAAEKSVSLELIAPEETFVVQGLSTAIDILITNLIDNAIRYTHPKTSIQVVLEKKKSRILFKVIDSGPGIPKKLHKRVFDRFFRIPGNKATGSGLGLNIVKQIADIHDATISLRTPSSGNGLEIRVNFPR